MHLSVSALSAAIVAFSWESDPGITYTLQTSSDLTHWVTATTVLEGDGQPLSLAFPKPHGVLFGRLRSSTEGDSNENGLPDTWEWRTFGYLDVRADADPDLDGLTTFEEWRGGSDPLDVYNGELPILRNASGTIWHIPAGTTSLAFTDLQLRDIHGTALPNRIITISTESGRACLVHSAAGDGIPAARVDLQTDAFGNIGLRNGLRYHNDGSSTGTDGLLISAGLARLRIAMALDPPPGQDIPLPRNVQTKRLPGWRTEVSWTGVPLPATELIFEKYDENRGWERLQRLSANELPAPDPATGRFTLIIPDAQ